MRSRQHGTNSILEALESIAQALDLENEEDKGHQEEQKDNEEDKEEKRGQSLEGQRWCQAAEETGLTTAMF